MPGPSKTLLTEGSFTELAEEFAKYIDNLKSQQNDEGSSLSSQVATQLSELSQLQTQEQEGEGLTEEQDDEMMEGREAVMKVLVAACSVLNTAPEKEFTAAYNLLVYLVDQTPNPNIYLPRICAALSQPIPSSPLHGTAQALSVLQTIFNNLPHSSTSRYHVLLAILTVIRSSPTSQSSLKAFEALKPVLSAQLPSWLSAWEVDEEAARKLYLMISSLASDAGDPVLSYNNLLHALNETPQSDSASPEARQLAIRALTTGLTLPTVFDFTPLTALDPIQMLRRSDPLLFELLEIFAADTLDTYDEFSAQSPNPLTDVQALSSPSAQEILLTKIRVLTLSSLAASSQNRSLPYSTIASSLRIDKEDVEKWVIDTIRAGLVEGKLSQLKSEFLVQRATYRVFGEKQWSEVQGRLMIWKKSLESVLVVIGGQKESLQRELEGGGGGRENGFGEDGEGQGQRQGGRDGGRRRGGGGDRGGRGGRRED